MRGPAILSDRVMWGVLILFAALFVGLGAAGLLWGATDDALVLKV